jgi:hypothetical protein
MSVPSKLVVCVLVVAMTVAGIFLLGKICLKRSIGRVDFGGLRSQLTRPVMQEITVDVIGDHGQRIEKGFDVTYIRANQIGMSAAQLHSIPATSSEILIIPAKDRADAWGNPFCLLKFNDLVAVMSFGPQGGSECSRLAAELPEVKHVRPGFL